MTVTLGEELLPFLDRLSLLLEKYDPVTQQKLIELLVVRHLMKVGQPNEKFVLDSMNKHIKQIVQQLHGYRSE